MMVDICKEKIKRMCKKGLSYSNIHNWLIRKHGKADHCDNPKCKQNSKTFEWAHIKETPMDKDLNSFHQLCRSCHTLYDFNEETYNKMSKSRKGKPFSEEHKKALKTPKKIVHRGYKISDQGRKNISIGCLGNTNGSGRRGKKYKKN